MSNHKNSQPIIAKNKPVMLFDGEPQGKSGHGAAAAVLLMSHSRRYTITQLVSFASEDEAEYMGLIIGLKKAQKLGIRTLEIKGDSEIVFNQVNGLTPVTEERLIRLHRKAVKLMKSFDHVSLEWITPENNRSATSAVKRCIKEALNDQQSSSKMPTANEMAEAIADLIQKGDQCEDEDYRQLTASLDQWTNKSLSELRTLIPLEVQDAIALQWQGGEENLAQMYRWYLRGLPPDMASRKVNLAQTSHSSIEAKLPWEEALIAPPNPLPAISDSEDLLVSLVSELAQTEFDPLEHFLTNSMALEMPLSSEKTNTDSQSSLDPLDFLPPDEQPQSSEESVELIDFAQVSLDEIEPLEELSGKPQLKQDTHLGKDTLPSESRVNHIVEMINNLSVEEKIVFVEKLVNFPELVNLILKAIAEKVSQGKSLS